MEENLVGYLLNALDDDTHRQVEASLRESPELRSRLELLQRALTPLASDRQAPEPRTGLVLSTLSRLAEYQCRKLPDAPPPPRSQTLTTGRVWLRRADALVAALMLTFLGGIGSSFVLHLWRDYGRKACQENLRRIGSGLQNYCDVHDGNFPVVEEKGPHGVAGIFVPVLCDSGMLGPDVSIACPAKERRQPVNRSVREMEELFASDPQRFRKEALNLAGGYAYSLGYVDAIGYHGLRRDFGDRLPIVSDRLESLTQTNSFNHGGVGQNVLHIGGNVEWRTDRYAGIDRDDIFVNKDYKVLAGKGREDTVLGPGDASPTPRE
jgi:hypothetical protein